MNTIDAILSVRSVPPKIIVLTSLASYGGIILASAADWPVWATVAAGGAPWSFIFLAETRWTWQNYDWLALFYVLVISQAGHFVEHVVQMVQLHVLDLGGEEARGVFGQLDVEWVHLAWNTWVLAALALLLRRFRQNSWLFVSLAAGLWHQLEHVYIVSQYVGASGDPGGPGLLARGGLIAGGLPLSRPDLHFWYNVVETVPIVLAFRWQLGRIHADWLAREALHIASGLEEVGAKRILRT